MSRIEYSPAFAFVELLGGVRKVQDEFALIKAVLLPP